MQQGKTQRERRRARGTPTLALRHGPKRRRVRRREEKKKKNLPQPKPDGERWKGTQDDTEIKADPRPPSGGAKAGVTAAICGPLRQARYEGKGEGSGG